MIELEARGEIKDFEGVLSKIRKKAEFVEEKDRFSLIYSKTDPREDVRNIRNEKVDMKLRVTNKKAEWVMKYGNWGGADARREILIPIPLDKFWEAVELLGYIGWNKGMIMATKTFVFNYKDVEIALVKARNGNYFEAEVVALSDGNKIEELQKIRDICEDLGLRVFSDEEFMDFLNKMNSSPDAVFDFEEQTVEDIMKDYGDYF